MVKAWQALDKAATQRGADGLPPACWEVTLDNGTVAVIVRDDEAASLVVEDGRRKAVWTVEEIGRILSARADAVNTAKVIFAGATVRKVRTPRDPLDDGLPF